MRDKETEDFLANYLLPGQRVYVPPAEEDLRTRVRVDRFLGKIEVQEDELIAKLAKERIFYG